MSVLSSQELAIHPSIAPPYTTGRTSFRCCAACGAGCAPLPPPPPPPLAAEEEDEAEADEATDAARPPPPLTPAPRVGTAGTPVVPLLLLLLFDEEVDDEGSSPMSLRNCSPSATDTGPPCSPRSRAHARRKRAFSCGQSGIVAMSARWSVSVPRCGVST